MVSFIQGPEFVLILCIHCGACLSKMAKKKKDFHVVHFWFVSSMSSRMDHITCLQVLLKSFSVKGFVTPVVDFCMLVVGLRVFIFSNYIHYVMITKTKRDYSTLMVHFTVGSINAVNQCGCLFNNSCLFRNELFLLVYCM